MADTKLKIGETVCYKCGSPTFVIKKIVKDGDLILSWFNSKIHAHQDIRVPPHLVELVEDFNERKLKIETQFDKRLYRVPEGLPLDHILTIGFDSAELKQSFLERMFDEQMQARILGDDEPLKH